MTAPAIARLRELLAAATPGEWEGVPNHPMPTADYDLIVAAHNALPALLDVVEAATKNTTFPADHPILAALKRLEGGE